MVCLFSTYNLFHFYKSLISLSCVWRISAQITDEEVALVWLEQYNEESEVVLFNYVDGSWNYNTNLTDENLQAEVSHIMQIK